jgi:hypothetical protein
MAVEDQLSEHLGSTTLSLPSTRHRLFKVPSMSTTIMFSTSQPFYRQSSINRDSPISSSIMSSPTLTPKTSLSAKERKLKLRASCDSCAASKVKCSKEHPRCARCSANNSTCVYGVSRKHGKPGRTRKRNPDGTPFIKVSKQRPSPDGSEFGKFRLQPTAMAQGTPDFEIASNWASDWSPTPSVPATPEYSFETTPEPFYMNTDTSDFGFMDDNIMSTPRLQPERKHTVENGFMFRNPFVKEQSVQLDLPDMQALQDYIGGDVVNSTDYTFVNAPTTEITYQAFSSPSTSHSPRSQPVDSYNTMPMASSISMSIAHCCNSLAYSTLESLKNIGPNAMHAEPMTQNIFDSVLSITGLAAESILRLVSCPCSSDPHLAMLYSSITSKILAWYQIAAGVNVTASTCTSVSSLPRGASSYTSSLPTAGFSSPSTTSDVEDDTILQMQLLHFGTFDFDKPAQQRRRRQVVLRELSKCGQLVEALASWTGEGLACEQAEFLYDILGAWLKSELYKTVKEVEAAVAL